MDTFHREVWVASHWTPRLTDRWASTLRGRTVQVWHHFQDALHNWPSWRRMSRYGKHQRRWISQTRQYVNLTWRLRASPEGQINELSKKAAGKTELLTSSASLWIGQNKDGEQTDAKFGDTPIDGGAEKVKGITSIHPNHKASGGYWRDCSRHTPNYTIEYTGMLRSKQQSSTDPKYV